MGDLLLQLELLRSQVIQTAYSFPGAKIPDRHMDDDEVLAALKGYISQHAELLKKNQVCTALHFSNSQMLQQKSQD